MGLAVEPQVTHIRSTAAGIRIAIANEPSGPFD